MQYISSTFSHLSEFLLIVVDESCTNESRQLLGRINVKHITFILAQGKIIEICKIYGLV